MTIRVFLDANVLFSASNEPSHIARLIRMLIEHGEAVTSDFAVEETRRNIMIKRPGWTETFDRLMDDIQIVPSIQFDLPVELVDKDKPHFEEVELSQVEHVETGEGWVGSGMRISTCHVL